jgi:hypothetical protein
LKLAPSIEGAIEALLQKHSEEAMQQRNLEESRKRQEALTKEDAWWTHSRTLLTELLFEYQDCLKPDPCDCVPESLKKVLAVDIKGESISRGHQEVKF